MCTQKVESHMKRVGIIPSNGSEGQYLGREVMVEKLIMIWKIEISRLKAKQPFWTLGGPGARSTSSLDPYPNFRLTQAYPLIHGHVRKKNLQTIAAAFVCLSTNPNRWSKPHFHKLIFEIYRDIRRNTARNRESSPGYVPRVRPIHLSNDDLRRKQITTGQDGRWKTPTLVKHPAHSRSTSTTLRWMIVRTWVKSQQLLSWGQASWLFSAGMLSVCGTAENGEPVEPEGEKIWAAPNLSLFTLKEGPMVWSV